ncbi:MAG: hypothetical protein ACRC33_00400, partial [Gemmataceae bacterium]
MGTARRDGSASGVAAFLVLACCTTTAGAQDPKAGPALTTLIPTGARTSLTDGWGAVGFALSNPQADDLEARLLTFHAASPGVQYGRDLWVPARSVRRSWSCVGPPPAPPGRTIVELKSLLYDRTGGGERLLRSPEGPPLRSDLVRYSPREPGTAVMHDADISDGSQDRTSAADGKRADEVLDLVRSFRHQVRLSEAVNPVKQRFLPPTPEAMDGLEHFVLATDRIAEDVAGKQALR